MRQVRAEFFTDVTDLVTALALDRRGFREEVAASGNVSGQLQNVRRVDGVAEPFCSQVRRQERFKQVARCEVFVLRGGCDGQFLNSRWQAF